MGRLRFNSSGKLDSVDGAGLEKFPEISKKKEFEEGDFELDDEGYDFRESRDLKKSGDLDFLKEEDSESKEREDIFERNYWNLYSNDEKLKPLRFSNGKTQEDVVKEIVGLIEEGNKVIFLHGACGTGKSAIALNIARILGKASVVVPVKTLQRQYEEDYMGKKYLLKDSGNKMKIAMITGRDNHDSIIKPGISCADPTLPENIKIAEKNYEQLLDYYKENPLIKNKVEPELHQLRRMSVAPSNPYWSPILPADFEVNNLSDAKKVKYKAIGGDYIFYHRKEGCSYYDQFLAYKRADVIIFNAAKYMSEFGMGRKPETDVEIIDEADDFLDGLFHQAELNLTRLSGSLKMIVPDDRDARDVMDKILENIELEEKNKRLLGIDEDDVFPIGETKMLEIIRLFMKNGELESEIALDEMNYSNRALELARNFKDVLSEVYVSFRKEEENLYVKLVSTNLSGKFRDLIDKNKALVFMSGTLHSESVLKNIFGIKEFKIVEAETLNLGNVEIMMTGKEFDCRYSTFSSKTKSREDYLDALKSCLERSKKPTLVHVNAFSDLPSENRGEDSDYFSVMSGEKLGKMQREDKTGKSISLFKSGMSNTLFTTKCARGVDFPGDSCNSMVFTKYPNPNVKDTFWKILERTHKDYYWDFYKDKARREFLQRIYRAVRSRDDHVFVLSPDKRVLDAVQQLQREMQVALAKVPNNKI